MPQPNPLNVTFYQTCNAGRAGAQPYRATRADTPTRRKLVSFPRNTRYFVAIKMGRRQGGPSRTGSGGSISKAIRDRRTTQPPADFHRNPLGRGQLAVFPRCSLDPYDSDMGASPVRSDRLEKQPTGLRQNTSYFGDRTLGLEPVPELFAALVKTIKQQSHLLVSLRPGWVRNDFAAVSDLLRNDCLEIRK